MRFSPTQQDVLLQHTNRHTALQRPSTRTRRQQLRPRTDLNRSTLPATKVLSSNPAANRMATVADPAALWSSLSDVERTAVQVSLYRCEAANQLRSADGTPLFDSSLDQAILDGAMPKDVQEELRNKFMRNLLLWMGIRTAVIDAECLQAVRGTSVHQVVILGAGLDLRAWRLPWAEGSTVYEVDSGAVEAFKCQAMAGVSPKGPACRRVFVRADLADGQALLQGLRGAGFDEGQATLWVLEGLVGYLSREQSLALFRTMWSCCGAGSKVVMTTPPTLETKAEAEREGQKLYHSTFEAPEETLARFVQAGWDGQLLDLSKAGPQETQGGLSWQGLLGDPVDTKLRFVVGHK